MRRGLREERDVSELAHTRTIERAKKYAAAAQHAKQRGEHRRAALLYTVAATLLEPVLPPLGPAAACDARGEHGKTDT